MCEEIDYIKLEDCEHGKVYELHSRNLSIGVFNKADNGFIGIRYKFGSEYLFTEYHWDTGEPYGTVKPQKLIAALPEEIPCDEEISLVENKALFDFLKQLRA